MSKGPCLHSGAARGHSVMTAPPRDQSQLPHGHTHLLFCLVPVVLEIVLICGGSELTSLWNLGGQNALDTGQEEMGVYCRTSPPGQH